MNDLGPWLLVVLKGCAVGGVEIVSIWRDAPGRTLLTRPALGYMALNGAPSAVALALTKLFQWSFGINSSDTSKVQWVQLLAAGFGAMTLLRSSLLTFRAGDDPIAVGPGKLLLTLLTAVGERLTELAQKIDRRRLPP